MTNSSSLYQPWFPKISEEDRKRASQQSTERLFELLEARQQEAAQAVDSAASVTVDG